MATPREVRQQWDQMKESLNEVGAMTTYVYMIMKLLIKKGIISDEEIQEFADENKNKAAATTERLQSARTGSVESDNGDW